MQQEETNIIYRAKDLPEQIMSHAEYKRVRDQAVFNMVGQRLAVKGELRLRHEMDEFALGAGIPDHRRVDIMRSQFERHAADKFTGQFDSQCNSCPHCTVDVQVEVSHQHHRHIMHAICYCKAKKSVGITCFDGFMPSNEQWVWPGDSNVVGAELRIEKSSKVMEATAQLVFHHASESEDYSIDPTRPPGFRMSAYGDLHNEPPGPMTRINGDSGYLTEKEMILANEALERTSKFIRASLPTPKPATPIDDAW